MKGKNKSDFDIEAEQMFSFIGYKYEGTSGEYCFFTDDNGEYKSEKITTIWNTIRKMYGTY